MRSLVHSKIYSLHFHINKMLLLSQEINFLFGYLHLLRVIVNKTYAGSAKSWRQWIDQALDTLTPREREVLRLRFGLNDGQVRSLAEVGRQFKVTRERIRQIEAKAIRKLKHPLYTKTLLGITRQRK